MAALVETFEILISECEPPEVRMAALTDLRSHLEGQLAAKRDALVETESDLRYRERPDH